MAWSYGVPVQAADQRNSLLKVAMDPNYLHKFERRLGDSWKRDC